MSVGCGGIPHPPSHPLLYRASFGWADFLLSSSHYTRPVRTEPSHCHQPSSVERERLCGRRLCRRPSHMWSPLNSFLPLEPLGGGPRGQHLGWALGIGGLAPNRPGTRQHQLRGSPPAPGQLRKESEKRASGHQWTAA